MKKNKSIKIKSRSDRIER